MVMYQVLKLDQLHGDDAIVVLVGPVERGLVEYDIVPARTHTLSIKYG